MGPEWVGIKLSEISFPLLNAGIREASVNELLLMYDGGQERKKGRLTQSVLAQSSMMLQSHQNLAQQEPHTFLDPAAPYRSSVLATGG